MKVATATSALLVGMAAGHDVAAIEPCKTNAWGMCGDQWGSTCCPAKQFCLPLNPGFYQCNDIPSQCPTQLTDIEFPGNDLGWSRARNLAECCLACASDHECKAYTFVNYTRDGPQCYLKRSAGSGRGVPRRGAVSSRVRI